MTVDELYDNSHFRNIWWRTEGIPGSFTRLNAAKLYEYAMQLKPGETVVEVGVDQGRSASVLLATALVTKAKVILVDSWESILIDNKYRVEGLVRGLAPAIGIIIHAKSLDAARVIPHDIQMLHIDAHHYEDNPANDCKAWLPKLVSGGIACFHDYMATFPAVTEAVNTYTEGWEDLGSHDSLAIRRKP